MPSVSRPASAPAWGIPLLLALAAAPAADGRDDVVGQPPVTREEFEKLKKELSDLKAAGLSTAPAGMGGLYDTRPALTQLAPRTYVGGYFDVEFIDRENADHDFRFHRFVPFFAADIHERVKFASEIEIEDGEEVGIEFAHVDILLFEPVNFRGGVILSPLGRFNLFHDSPLNDLTDRPLVNQFVIPTTMREVGVGLFGSLNLGTSDWEVKYEAYITSGFKGLSGDPAGDPTITQANGLRGARAHTDALGTRNFGDNNNDFAGVGRLSVSPFLGSEVGASVHHGAYDAKGDNDLTVAAIDGLYTIRQFEVMDLPVGPVEFLGEGAYAFIERGAFARSEGVPGDLWGYYLQVNYHFLVEYFLPRGTRATTALFPDSTFTLVGRWDQTDLDGNRLERITVGINFRPVEATVLKFDYQFNRGSHDAADSADDDAFLISLASYF